MTTPAYTNDFFDLQKEGSLQSARIVVPVLLNLVRPASVIDIGCGHGAWLRAFKENGVQVLKGFDGSYVDRSKLLIDPACFNPVDLTRPFKIRERYDLAVCLEVGEHLPEKVSQSLVAELTEAAPLVLFSAAIPGQRGLNHVNEQWPSYWQTSFERRGFHRLDPIRRHILMESKVEWWYRQNIFLYASQDAIANSSALQAEKELANNMDFELIHGSIFYRYKSLRGILREVPRVARRKIKDYLKSIA